MYAIILHIKKAKSQKITLITVIMSIVAVIKAKES